jgi:hypothetical protein
MKKITNHKLMPEIRCSHLGTFFRVNLGDYNCNDKLEFLTTHFKESVAFEIIGVKNNKLKVRVWHIVYKGNSGIPTKHSQEVYEIDLTKQYDEEGKLKLIKEK